MPLMQAVLFYIPTFVIGILMVGGAVAISIGGLFLVRRFIPGQKMKAHNDVAGFIFATIGVIYAVLLAFIVIISWENFDKTHTNVIREANCLADVYRDSVGLSPDFRIKLNASLNAYVKGIIEDEWPLLATGERSPRVQKLSTNIYKLYADYTPKTETEKIFFTESLHKRNEAGELRRQRIFDSQNGVHPVLWSVLIIGGVITMFFTFLFGTENFAAHLLMASSLAALIGLILFTIIVLDYPFTGSVRITPEAFKMILQNLATL
jgi:hypothetical protein